ncbi:glyoxalase superfamily protein [Lichenibacterium ramalinae]|uniref:glyoxalase superfamily protein n=1 Tax=Lichenibacterium ramalinae TaxID=2316527 RepID=UPI001FE17241|nr:glyoxalase superfamily protein [Lichenibacterium ramalinae]
MAESKGAVYLTGEGVGFRQACLTLRIFDEAKSKQSDLRFLGFSLEPEHRFGIGFPLYTQVSRAGLSAVARRFVLGMPKANRLASPFWISRPPTRTELCKTNHLNRIGYHSPAEALLILNGCFRTNQPGARRRVRVGSGRSSVMKDVTSRCQTAPSPPALDPRQNFGSPR